MMGSGDPYAMRPTVRETPVEEDIKAFNWKELDGKTVRVYVYEEEGVQISALYEADTQEFFIVSIKQLEETK